MLTQKKLRPENKMAIVIFFCFVSIQEKDMRDLTDFLRKHHIFLHKNTKDLKKRLLENNKQELRLSLQANYIGIGSQEIGEKQLQDILLFLSLKNTKYMSFSFSYEQKFLRPKVLS